jgi:hypothetical protein
MQRIFLRLSIKDYYHYILSDRSMCLFLKVGDPVHTRRGLDAAMKKRRLRVAYAGGLELEKG